MLYHSLVIWHSSRGRAVLFLVFVAFVFLLGTSSLGKRAGLYYQRNFSGRNGQAQRRTHIAVASDFNQHFDVHLAAAHTIRQVLGNDHGHLQVFAHEPLLHGFQDIVESLHLYEDEIRHPDELMGFMRSSHNYPEEPGRMTELLLLGTCEVDMRRWSDELLEIWDSREDDQKFVIVCIVHHFRDTTWQSHITPWARRRAIRLLPIGKHVGRAFRTRFLELADNNDPDIYNAMYEYIDIDVHAPVLDLPEYVERPRRSKPSKVAIQGNFQTDRRDYPHIFEDLIEAFQRDPKHWGYRSLARDRVIYEPLEESSDETFELHLIGEGQLEIPLALSEAVFIHRGLNYTDFYSLMQSMDLVIPAFVNVDYYDFQASSTVAMAVQCNVPILASRRMREAYGYIDDDRVVVTRPQALREIAAIGAFRDARTSALEQSSVFTGRFAEDVTLMLKDSWQRSQRGFQDFKKELWRDNQNAIKRALDGDEGLI